jgi:hypothetical protein
MQQTFAGFQEAVFLSYGDGGYAKMKGRGEMTKHIVVG